jgi:hypothetical protein
MKDRMQRSVQFVVGVLLWIGLMSCFLYSPLRLWWEPIYSDGSQPLTWRSALIAIVLLLAAQYASRFLFTCFAARRR